MSKQETDRLLAAIVDLRLLAKQTREPDTRARLRRLERSLRRLLGPGIPKTRAAAHLGESVTALDRWIARGRLPVVAKEGSSRRTVESGPFLELAEQVEELRRAGLERGLLAEALSRLGWPDDPDGEQVVREELARLPRPNVSVQ